MRSRLLRVFILMLLMIVILPSVGIKIYAKDTSENVSVRRFEFSEKDNYAFDENKGKSVAKTENYGNVIIKGDFIKKNDDMFYVQKGLLDLSYETLLKGEPTDDEWHIVEDKTKTVNGVKLDSNIKSGAIIVQSSLDGENWLVDKTYTDVFDNRDQIKNTIFTTKELHQLNGCYYRVTVVYKQERKTGSSKVLLWNKDAYEYRNIAEVYNFYVIDQDTVDNGAASSDGKPRREFSTVINTGKDNGFDASKAKPMDKDDPHFNKSIGYFTVNGYTRETTEKDGTTVFLKTLGDDVTLWFNLTEDINKLFGNEKLKISEDNKAYDKEMGVDETSFKHGALIVKYTDEEGHSPETIKYFDFLAANAMTGADTRIKLYEEGDYEVTLDYEIVNTAGIDSYTNYKITFKFAIRNGNTMAFPRDSVTGSELKDGAYSANGFTVDMAESKYLTIDVLRKEITQNSDGTLSTSVRNNTVGKDGSTYTKPGVYEITVKNQYSDGSPTTVTLYIGSDKNIAALSTNHMSVDELNEMIKSGVTVEEDGSLKMPNSEPLEVAEDKTTEITVEENTGNNKVDDVVEEVSTQQNSVETVNEEVAKDVTEKTEIPVVPIVIVAIIAVSGLMIVYKKKNKEASHE